ALEVHEVQNCVLAIVNVRGGNVFVRADDGGNLVGVAASQVLQLVLGKLVGIADDATFCTSERNVNDGAFPGHPHSERLDFVEGDVGMITNAALAGAAHAAV